MPYDAGIAVYDGGDYRAALERALAEAGDEGPGVGVACVVEGTGTPAVETARARLEPSGMVTITAGSSSLGQGHRTTFAQIAAGALGVAPETVRVVEGDTGAIKAGGGTFASRTAVNIGSAVLRAAEELRRARDAQPEAAALEVEASFETTAQTFAYGACAARAEVDTETGAVRLLGLAVVVDAGRAINPEVVRGQLHGGAAHGAGGALFEELAFDADGQPVTGGLRDYHLPLAGDLPAIRAVVLEEAPSQANPLGARGVGEIAVSAAAAAIANAVAAASGREVDELPIRPESLACYHSSR
jgi:carbon-monoxide dehydrogenase large subunit